MFNFERNSETALQIDRKLILIALELNLLLDYAIFGGGVRHDYAHLQSIQCKETVTPETLRKTMSFGLIIEIKMQPFTFPRE